MSTIRLSYRNNRGYRQGMFQDHYKEDCSIAESSLADTPCIWLGIDGVTAKVMARDAAKHGLDPGDGTGWVDFPIPKEVSIATHMHLTQEMVAALIPLMQHFVDHGELPKP